MTTQSRTMTLLAGDAGPVVQVFAAGGSPGAVSGAFADATPLFVQAYAKDGGLSPRARRVERPNKGRRAVLKRAEVNGVDIAWAVEGRVRKDERRRSVCEIRFSINERATLRDFQIINAASRIRDLDGDSLPNSATVGDGLPIHALDDDGWKGIAFWKRVSGTLAIGVVVLNMVLAGQLALAGEFSRELALEKLKTNVQAVRDKMDADPGTVGFLLVGFMARPIGDRPEVLDTCDYVISNSTNPLSVRAAAEAMRIVVGWHRSRIPRNHWPKIAAVLEQSAMRGDLQTRLYAAEGLFYLSGKYEKEAEDIVLQIISQPREMSDSQLLSSVAKTFGYLPEVVKLYSEGIEKSSDVVVGYQTVIQLKEILEENRQKVLRRNKKPDLARIFRRALEFKDLRVRLIAAEAIGLLGGEYRDESYRALLALLNNPHEPVDSDIKRWFIVEAMRDVLVFNRSDSIEAVRGAAEKYEVHKFLEVQVRNSLDKKLQREYRALLQRLNTLAPRQDHE